MESYSGLIYLYISVPLIVIGIFAYFFLQKNTLLDVEKYRKAIYTEILGGTIGIFNYKGPFIRLSIYDDFMVISYVKKILLRYYEITGIEIKKIFFVNCLYIYHNRVDYPQKIVLWPKDCKMVKEIIAEKLGKERSKRINF